MDEKGLAEAELNRSAYSCRFGNLLSLCPLQKRDSPAFALIPLRVQSAFSTGQR